MADILVRIDATTWSDSLTALAASNNALSSGATKTAGASALTALNAAVTVTQATSIAKIDANRHPSHMGFLSSALAGFKIDFIFGLKKTQKTIA